MGAGGQEYQRARWAIEIDQTGQTIPFLKLFGAGPGLAIRRHRGGRQRGLIHLQAIEKLVTWSIRTIIVQAISDSRHKDHRRPTLTHPQPPGDLFRHPLESTINVEHRYIPSYDPGHQS
jgi:hypothetical protein